MTRSGARLALALALAACGDGGPRAPLDVVRAPVIGGVPDAERGAVLALRRADGSTCSAVLIAPTIALTAGHCTWGAPVSSLSLTYGASAATPERVFGVTRLALYPTATQGDADAVGGVDLAALELDGAPPVASFSMAPDLGPDAPRGLPVTVVGFGRTQPFDPSSAGTREAVTLPIGRACTRTVRLGDETKNTCFGDSGGALLLDGALFGVVSAGRDGCNTPSFATRLDAHRAWLARVRAGLFDEPCPECVAPSDACDAPIEVLPPEPVVGSPWVRAGGGGCAVGGSAVASPGLGAALLLCAVLRRGRRARRARAARRARVATS